MSRLGATIAIDLRQQLRNGFYYATALVVVFSILLLRWLPADVAALVLPVVVVQNVLINTFYFVSGLLLLERVEGTFAARSVTPLRVDEVLASKLITLTLLSLVESLLIGVAAFGFHRWLITLALGVALSASLFCSVGVALVLRYDSVNQFLMPSVVYAALLTLPILRIFGIGSEAWFLPHPVEGPLELMRPVAPPAGGRLAYAIGYPLLWIVPAYLWSRRALRRVRAS